jgi:D-serine deaminase-like pyridoxal phosphate-dependent protein
MLAPYAIRTPDEIDSPGLVIFRDLVEQNMARMIEIAGRADRLRPHCKTHKMADVVRLQVARGITRHKCATIAEAEMLAREGVNDVVLGYSPVGPNIGRVAEFAAKYPEVSLAVTADDRHIIGQLGDAVAARGRVVGVLLDIDPGRQRTGVPVGREARALYEQLARTRGLSPAGLHVYDGHQRQPDLSDRRAAVTAEWAKIAAFRDELEETGLPVPRIVCGGTPTFPVYASLTDPAIELSPGTCVFHDAAYRGTFTDLSGFTPAALVLTRVVSRPTPTRVTWDVGTKAIAADPPMGQRLVFPEIPDAVQVLQNEEHLVIETAEASRWSPGDWSCVIPQHVCPTIALHREGTVVSGGVIVSRWPVTARDRRLTV